MKEYQSKIFKMVHDVISLNHDLKCAVLTHKWDPFKSDIVCLNSKVSNIQGDEER